MLVEKNCPVGVDAVISKMQRDLFIELTKNFGWKNYESYHRAYKNKKGDDLLPEAYTEKGEYKEVLFDDTKTVTSFFLVDDQRTYDSTSFCYTQEISIIYQARLEKLFCEVKHRADEELIDNIRLAIKKKNWDVQLFEIITEVDKVYDSLKIGYDKKAFDNMGDFAMARFNFRVVYTNTEKVTALQ